MDDLTAGDPSGMILQLGTLQNMQCNKFESKKMQFQKGGFKNNGLQKKVACAGPA